MEQTPRFTSQQLTCPSRKFHAAHCGSLILKTNRRLNRLAVVPESSGPKKRNVKETNPSFLRARSCRTKDPTIVQRPRRAPYANPIRGRGPLRRPEALLKGATATLRDHTRVSQKCHTSLGKSPQNREGKVKRKEKMVGAGLQQLFDCAVFLSVPASSRKFRPPATNQKFGSSNRSGRSIFH